MLRAVMNEPMSNTFRIARFACLLIACIVTLPRPALATKAAVGFNFSKELFLPGSPLADDLGQLQLDLYIGYYFTERFAMTAGFATDVEPSSPNDPVDKGVTLGFGYYLAPIRDLCPYLKTEGIFYLDPDLSFGFRAGPGLRYDLFRIFGLDGAHLAYTPSFKAIYEKEGGPYYSLELFRLGFEYLF